MPPDLFVTISFNILYIKTIAQPAKLKASIVISTRGSPSNEDMNNMIYSKMLVIW